MDKITYRYDWKMKSWYPVFVPDRAMRLSERDKLTLLEALLEDSEPNEALQKAAKAYDRYIQRGE